MAFGFLAELEPTIRALFGAFLFGRVKGAEVVARKDRNPWSWKVARGFPCVDPVAAGSRVFDLYVA